MKLLSRFIYPSTYMHIHTHKQTNRCPQFVTQCFVYLYGKEVTAQETMGQRNWNGKWVNQMRIWPNVNTNNTQTKPIQKETYPLTNQPTNQPLMQTPFVQWPVNNYFNILSKYLFSIFCAIFDSILFNGKFIAGIFLWICIFFFFVLLLHNLNSHLLTILFLFDFKFYRFFMTPQLTEFCFRLAFVSFYYPSCRRLRSFSQTNVSRSIQKLN